MCDLFNGPTYRAIQVEKFVANSSSLTHLSLQLCSLRGTFPRHIFQLLSIEVITVFTNPSLSGSLPEFPFGSNLKTLSISSTQFSGTLPDSIGNLIGDIAMVLVKIQTMFMSIDISNNNFYGEIPSTIGDLQSLIVLNLSSNNFQGLTSSTLGNLVELQLLDLSSTRLSGRIPQELASLTFLQYLNLSYNQLTGQVPRGSQFHSFPDSLEGSLDLCGFPLPNKCESITEGTPTPDPSHSEESDSKNGIGWKAMLIGYGCGFVFGLIGAGYLRILKKPDLLI